MALLGFPWLPMVSNGGGSSIRSMGRILQMQGPPSGLKGNETETKCLVCGPANETNWNHHFQAVLNNAYA